MSQSPIGKMQLTLHLSQDLALRLKLAADAQKRPPADLVADLLDRHLPQADSGKGKIPYL